MPLVGPARRLSRLENAVCSRGRQQAPRGARATHARAPLGQRLNAKAQSELTLAMRTPALIALALSAAACATAVDPAPQGPAQSMSEIIAQSPASDWRPLDPENTLYMDLAAGRIVIE